MRWLRSDGRPNWSQRVAKLSGELEGVYSKPAITVRSSSTVMEATEIIASHNVRGLPVTSLGMVVGALTASDLVDYLGGGPYFDIVMKRHEGNVFRALKEEKVSSIFREVPLVTVEDSLQKVLELMILRGTGFLPVVDDEQRPVGVITEHDLLKLVLDKKIGVKVSELFSSPIVTVGKGDSLKRAAELMVKTGFRRIVAVEGEEAVGSVSAKGFVSFFGTHKAFRYLKSTNIGDILTLSVSEIVEEGLYVIDHGADVGEAGENMLRNGTNWLLVTKGGEAIGIITERDVVMALALEV
ncbi:MAG: CBS domain-containing protein [Acidilobaceae archaeon]|nr:CBS domain-containing protein [Acidilobaceae archaeon]MCX8165723.1 CBS domain-containing protein [Acidilobaceae archaeon]MDW7974148.1 CBS domain-containing protein [Sulfolobales archaeon]